MVSVLKASGSISQETWAVVRLYSSQVWVSSKCGFPLCRDEGSGHSRSFPKHFLSMESSLQMESYTEL